MGLPGKWQHDEHGLCLSLALAQAHLQTRGAVYRVEAHTLIYQLPGEPEHRVEAVHVPALGRLYPQRDLDL